MKSLKEIIERSDSKEGRFFDLFIQSLILLSIITFSIETLPGLSEEVRVFLKYLETITIAIFSVEYILRLIVADRKLKFIFSLYGLIDLISILPFYLSGIDLRSLRILRMIRLFRILKLSRYNRAMTRLINALVASREQIVLFFVMLMILLFISSVGIYYFENPVQPKEFASVFHSLWWSVITLTTVGYGDVYPITIGGRIFTGIILMMGLGIVAIPTGIIASALSRAVDAKK